jgi:hypothetical protein
MTGERDLRQPFIAAGTVNKIKVMNDRRTVVPRSTYSASALLAGAVLT